MLNIKERIYTALFLFIYFINRKYSYECFKTIKGDCKYGSVNSMIFYITKGYWNRNNKVFDLVPSLLLKDPKTTKAVLEDLTDDNGEEYKKLLLERRNHFDFSNGSAIRFELDDGPFTSYTSKQVAKFMIDAVDTMV